MKKEALEQIRDLLKATKSDPAIFDKLVKQEEKPTPKSEVIDQAQELLKAIKGDPKALEGLEKSYREKTHDKPCPHCGGKQTVTSVKTDNVDDFEITCNNSNCSKGKKEGSLISRVNKQPKSFGKEEYKLFRPESGEPYDVQKPKTPPVDHPQETPPKKPEHPKPSTKDLVKEEFSPKFAKPAIKLPSMKSQLSQPKVQAKVARGLAVRSLARKNPKVNWQSTVPAIKSELNKAVVMAPGTQEVLTTGDLPGEKPGIAPATGHAMRQAALNWKFPEGKTFKDPKLDAVRKDIHAALAEKWEPRFPKKKLPKIPAHEQHKDPMAFPKPAQKPLKGEPLGVKQALKEKWVPRHKKPTPGKPDDAA